MPATFRPLFRSIGQMVLDTLGTALSRLGAFGESPLGFIAALLARLGFGVSGP